MNDSREILDHEITLYGESEGHEFPRAFYIDDFINAGSTVLCYTAHHEMSGKGTLREFYPVDAISLERTADGNLCHMPGFEDSRRRFEEKKNRYLDPYLTLLGAMQDDESGELNTFIPSFEIYHGRGSGGSGEGTVYIWCPEPKLKTFEEICREIHSKTGDRSGTDLLFLLKAVKKLTECVRKLHLLNLVHRDIKPENFGFQVRNKKILPDTVTLFDVDSICSVLDAPDAMIRSRGYTEPEAATHGLSNQMDIYSIGATLFRALIFTEENRDILYQDSLYEKIDELLSRSLLLAPSEESFHPKLAGVLGKILKGSLAPRHLRYAATADLMKDIDDALFFVLPFEIAARNYRGEKWVLADAERASREEYVRALQYHLYRYPIFRALPEPESEIRVAVFGFGKYSQAFLDLCLQSGQIWGKQLTVTVYTDNVKDQNARKSSKELYFEKRGTLPSFFSVDGYDEVTEDPYGTIHFVEFPVSGDPGAMAEGIQKILLDAEEAGKAPGYVFISYGEDSLNHAVALACQEAGEALELGIQVHYVVEDKVKKRRENSALYPVCIRENVSSSKEMHEIERMAFNTHLIWEKDLNIDYKTARERYLKPYYRQACISGVLSVKSKLFSLGIDLDASGFREAAAMYQGILRQKGEAAENRLMYIEHRRWVTEKLCLGYSDFERMEDCAAYNGKDEQGRRHCCIKRSRPDRLLAKTFTGASLKKWDEGSSQLGRLDDLDRMSVELHRAYKSSAEAVKIQNILNGDVIDSIDYLIENNDACVASFQEWYSCMKDMLSGDRSKVYLYSSLKDAFSKNCQALSARNREAVLGHVGNLDVMLRPVLRSLEYRDYKEEDTRIIRNIPFVLTYSTNLYLCIPYMTGANSSVFRNVAASVVLHPERVLYMAYLEKQEDYRSILSSLPYAAAFLRKKNVLPVMEFILLCGRGFCEYEDEAFLSDLKRASSDAVMQVRVFRGMDDKSIAGCLEGYLDQVREGKDLFLAERNDSALSWVLRGAGFYGQYPAYSYDPAAMRFQDLNECEWLSYLGKRPHISVADMTAFNMALSKKNAQPEFYRDYMDLWNIYKANKSGWKLLCDDLQNHSDQHDVIVTFAADIGGFCQNELKYILPFDCYRSCKKIVAYLRDKKMIGQGSVKVLPGDSCEICIKDTRAALPQFEKLFSDPYLLMHDDDISLDMKRSRNDLEIRVRHNSLIVRDAYLSGNSFRGKKEVLKELEKMRYIYNVRLNQDIVSFVYGSRQIKELLTMAGRMLEVYVYHKTKNLNLMQDGDRFDDIVSGYEISWEDPRITNEIDCIITKGFTMLFIECKARRDLSQDFYNKLYALSAKFGINVKTILISDTNEKNESSLNAEQNMVERTRGKEMNIITVWRQDEIDNIGQTLKEISDGTYVQKEWDEN